MRLSNWHNNISRHLRCVISLLIAAGSVISCSNKKNLVAMTDVNIVEWSEPVNVSLKNEVAESVGDLTIVLHVNRNFEAQQVEFEVVSMTADSLRYSEKISSKPHINWPIPAAQSVDVEIPYRRNVLMRKIGQYNYTITPLTPLQGVESVGMSFETEKQ